jgi:hypothetical protein
MLYADAEMPPWDEQGHSLCEGLCEVIDLMPNDGIKAPTMKMLGVMALHMRVQKGCFLFQLLEWEPRAMLCWLFAELCEEHNA